MIKATRPSRFAAAITVIASIIALCGCMDLEPSLNIPPPPNYLGVSSSTLNAVTLQWEAVSLAKTYKIYRASGADTLERLTEITATSWTDTGLDPESGYRYRVESVGEEGSNWSEITVRSALVHPFVRSVSIGAPDVGATDMSLDPTGAVFASVDIDVRGVRFWNTADWTLRGVVRPQSGGRPSCVAFSADGSTAYIGGWYGVEVVRVSDLQSVRNLRLCGSGPGDSIFVEDVVPVPGGTRGVITSDRGRLQVWDLSADTLVQTVDSIGPTTPQANAVSSNGRWLATTWGHGFAVWDLVSREVLYAAGGYPTGPQFNADGTLLSITANEGWEGSRRRWTLSTSTWLPVCTVPAEGSSASFRPDGQYELITTGHLVRVVRLPSGVVEETISGHLSYVAYVTYLPDGTSFMTRDGRNTVRIWSGEMRDGWTVVP